MPKAPIKLYWCTTDDHLEDWFVLARRPLQACRYFERSEGCDPGEANAEWVAGLPDKLQQVTCPDWPSDEIIEACGGMFLRHDTPRVVEVAGRRYAEGMLQQQIDELMDNEFELRGQGRPNGSVRTRHS
jgi:hypothetical protein